MAAYDALVKLVLLGESSVGKTALLLQYTRGHVPSSLPSTIGVWHHDVAPRPWCACLNLPLLLTVVWHVRCGAHPL